MYPRETLMRIVLLSLLLYAIASLAVTAGRLRRLEDTRAALDGRLDQLDGERAELTRALEDGTGDEELLRLARERLGLVLPGEKVFYFNTDREG